MDEGVIIKIANGLGAELGAICEQLKRIADALEGRPQKMGLIDALFATQQVQP